MMEVWYIVLSAIAVILVAFVAIILVRTALFRPKTKKSVPDEPVSFDGDAAIAALQQLIRCKTVSYYDHTLEDDGEFEKLIALLPRLYPEVCRICTLTRLPDRGLLFCWKGKKHDAPSVMMAHYDVVPVE